MVDREQLRALVEPVVLGLGLALYDVEISGSGRATVVRVLVDAPGGVDLDAVARATEAISPVLDAPPASTWLTGSYALEVSSPGLERPLRTPAHFRSAAGEAVSVKFRIGDAPARRERGTVEAADDDGFDLVLGDGARERIAYAEVLQARTVFEWGPTAPSRDQRERPREKVRR